MSDENHLRIEDLGLGLGFDDEDGELELYREMWEVRESIN